MQIPMRSARGATVSSAPQELHSKRYLVKNITRTYDQHLRPCGAQELNKWRPSRRRTPAIIAPSPHRPKLSPPTLGDFHMTIRAELTDEALSDLTARGYSRRSIGKVLSLFAAAP